MALTQTNQRVVRWTIVPLSIIACVIGAVVHVNRSVKASQTAPASARNITLGLGRPGSTLRRHSLGEKSRAGAGERFRPRHGERCEGRG